MSIALNTNQTLRLRVLTPVHVGAGTDKDWVRGVDFVQDGDQVFILKKEKTLTSLEPKSLEQYIQLLAAGDLFKTEKWLLKEIDADALSSIVFPFNGDLRGTAIKTIIRDGNGDTYFPGSSIKGALMSGIFHTIQKNKNIDLRYTKNPNDDVLGRFSTSIGRYLRPSDAVLNETELNIVSLFNLYLHGENARSEYKNGFNIPQETFLPEKEATFRLSIADGLAKAIKTHSGGSANSPRYLDELMKNDPISMLFKMVNDATSTHIERELAFFKRFPQATESEFLIECLEKMQAQIPENDSACVFRMSAGSGFHAMTGDWRIHDHVATVFRPDQNNTRTKDRMPAKYKSRKVFRANSELAGFVRVEKV
jgi:hypothetical protein